MTVNKSMIKLVALGVLVILLVWFIGRAINLKLDLALAEAKYQKQIAELDKTINGMSLVIDGLKYKYAEDSTKWIDKINVLDGKYLAEIDKIKVKSNRDLKNANATVDEVLAEKLKVEQKFTLCQNEVSELKLSIADREKQFAKQLADFDSAWQKKYDAMDTKYKTCEDFRVKLEKKLGKKGIGFWGVAERLFFAGAGFGLGRL
jgi:chromosome segregation ATPase